MGCLQKNKIAEQDIPEAVEKNIIKMGDMIIENWKSEIYLGYQIHEGGTSASITATLDSRIPTAIDRGNTILFICNQPSLIGFTIAHGPVEQYESKISSKILSNSDSWIGLTNKHIERMQLVQDNYFMKVFQVSDMGTPKCMFRLDSQTLQLKWQILQRKIKQVRKTMDKDDENICNKLGWAELTPGWGS